MRNLRVATKAIEVRLETYEESLEKAPASPDGPVVPNSGLYARYGKRALDIGLSSLALAVTLPVNLAVMAGAYVSVGKPILFKQVRAGKDGKPFIVRKVRSMTNETDADGVLLPSSERITKFGKFIRSTSLDELLQFWNILFGDMSVIGPRPMYLSYLDLYSDRHSMRHAVRPGLECPMREPLGRRRTYQDQFENDVWYVENLCFKTDCHMFVRLVREVFDRRRVKLRGIGGGTTFSGYKDGKANGTNYTEEQRKEFWEKENRLAAKAIEAKHRQLAAKWGLKGMLQHGVLR